MTIRPDGHFLRAPSAANHQETVNRVEPSALFCYPVPIRKRSFRRILVCCSKFYPRDTNYIPVVKLAHALYKKILRRHFK